MNGLPMAHCLYSGGKLIVIMGGLEQPVSEKILTRLGLRAKAPHGALSRVQALQAA